jgi:hypothetical protein
LRELVEHAVAPFQPVLDFEPVTPAESSTDRASPDSDDGEEYCGHCGAKIVEYKHTLSLHLVTALAKLKAHGGAGKIRLIPTMTKAEWTNFQKLRYFGLATQVLKDGQKKSGIWSITPEGDAFLNLLTPASAWVRTYRGLVVEMAVRRIYADQAAPGYRQAEDYAADARPHLSAVSGPAHAGRDTPDDTVVVGAQCDDLAA